MPESGGEGGGEWDVVNCSDDPRICPGETACGFHNVTATWMCLCYHTGTPPRNSTCQRNTVGEFRFGTPNLSQEISHPNSRNSGIPVQVVGSMGQVAAKEKTVNIESTDVAFVATALSFAVLLFLVSGLLFWKRKTLRKLFRKSDGSQKSGEKDGSGRLFPLDRFVLNPTYEASPLLDLTVPLFLPSQLNITHQIGQGCFGKVFRGELNGEGVAVKVARKENAHQVLKEVETMAAFNHPNILRILGVASNQDGEAPWLLFEFMEYGDLATLLRAQSPHKSVETKEDHELLELSTDDLLDVASQIAEGMNYLASQHFVHRDLAARNCLVGRGQKVKVSDFGLSRDVYTCDYYKIGGSRLLPVRWMSPESVLYGRFTLESDVWAYGVLLWEIYTWAKQPFYGHSNEEVVQLILDGVLLSPPPFCPPLVASLMAACWKSEPKDRLSFLDITRRFGQTTKEWTGREDELYERPRTKSRDEYMQVV